MLVDDRAESPGVKFKDADLLGLPLRLTLGEKSLKSGGVELKLRTSRNSEIVPVEKIVLTVQKTVADALNACS